MIRLLIRSTGKIYGSKTNFTLFFVCALRFSLSFREQVGRNICHGSDSVENAEKEIALWFGDSELVDHESAMKDWIYE